MHMFMASLGLIYIYWITKAVLPKESHHQQIVVNTSNPIFITDREYLSIAIDSSQIRNGWLHRNLRSRELIVLTKPLAPAYLRIGGTAADQLIFVPDEELNKDDLLLSKPFLAAKAEHGDYCDYGYHCNRNISDTFNMTVEDWLMMNRFVKETDLSLLFDLNVLLRHNNTWDSRNAKKLLTASTHFACNVSWQLGNAETSSAWGGGAKGLSDTYAAGFMWLDKLGLAAKLGINLVGRQTLCGGHYSLIDCDTFEPHPDWWLSVLFKRLVGQKVFSVQQKTSDSIRMYAHCANPTAGEGAVTLFGLNVGNEPVWLNIKGIEGPANAYILSGETGLHSSSVLLNEKTLQLNKDRTLPQLNPVNVSLDEGIMFPGFSLGFWITTAYKVQECYVV